MALPKFHWKRDVPDARDHIYQPVKLAAIPSIVDLRPYCSTIEDQGNLGSCTGNAIAGQIELIDRKSGKNLDVSRLFIYYQERLFEGTVNYDSGAYIRDGIKAVYTYGAPLESIWPYNINKFATRPNNAAYSDAAKRKVTGYQRCANFAAVKNALAAGSPVTIGFDVYSSFELIGSNGIMTYPNVRTEEYLGGHAVCLVGYNDNTQRFIARNSWGTSWGDRGYFYMPYSVIKDTSMSADFWLISSVVNNGVKLTPFDPPASSNGGAGLRLTSMSGAVGEGITITPTPVVTPTIPQTIPTVATANTPGPRGPQGEQGPMGPRGEKGDRGDQGPPGEVTTVEGKVVTGPQGLPGETGATGPQGIEGPIGATGPQGPSGNNGIDGKDGLPGKDGVNGTNGRDGTVGATGPKGDTGLTGATGLQGPAGTNGINGTNGLPGATGAQGLQGVAGATGLTGATGPAGKDGGQGLTIANTAATASWINLGTWTTVNQGTTLYMRIVAHAGFNADTNQSQVTELYFKTSNAVDNKAGFYADGSASRNPALGSCNVAPSVIRVVQNSQTSYTFYGYFPTWTNGSHYTFSTDGASTWTHSGALSTQPAGTSIDITPVASGTKTAAGYVNAGTFVTLDNIKATVTTVGNRGLSVATVAGTFTATISATYSCTGGGNGHSTAWPGGTYTTTPSGSWFGYHFPNAGDGSTYIVNDYNNQRVYRIHLMIGPGYNNNFISIERISDGIQPPPPPVAPVAVGVSAPRV